MARPSISAVDLVRTAARLQRVLNVVERAAFAVVAGIGGAYIAARVILDDWRARG